MTTRDPLFTAADAAGAPAPRPGVWLLFKRGDCQFDEARPFTEWPDCAGGALVSPTDIAAREASDPPGQLQRSPYVLAAGDPRIAQVLDPSAETTTAGSDNRRFYYAGLRPIRFDAQGRIVEFRFWPVVCGPSPPADVNDTTPKPTQHPYPGLEMRSGAPDCTTGSRDALRNAARASDLGPAAQDARWVRDGDR